MKILESDSEGEMEGVVRFRANTTTACGIQTPWLSTEETKIVRVIAHTQPHSLVSISVFETIFWV